MMVHFFIITDKPDIAEELTRALKHSGHGVCGSAGGRRQALDALPRTLPDIVIVDVALEGATGGVKIAESVHEEYRIPMLFLTDPDSAKALDAIPSIHPLGIIRTPLIQSEVRAVVKESVRKWIQEARLKKNTTFLDTPVELRSWSKQGEIVWLESTIQPIYDKQGKISYFQSASRDITQRKENEQIIRSNEEKYRNIFESIQDVYVETAWDGSLIDVSPSVSKLLGYEREELLRKPVGKLYKNPARRRELLEILENKGMVHDFEVTLLHRLGKEVYASFSLKLILNKEQANARILGTVRNVTQRKLQEQEIKNKQKNIAFNLRQQELLSHISIRLNSIENFDNKIKAVLRKLGEHSNVSRVYIFENNEDGTHISNTYEWTDASVDPQIDNLQNLPYEQIPDLIQAIMKHGMFYSENINHLPKDLYTLFSQQDIKSIIVYPLLIRGQYQGLIGFDECKTFRRWTKSEFELLKTVSSILSSTFERRSMKERLRTSLRTNEAVLQAIPDAILYFNDKDVVVDYKNSSQENGLVFYESPVNQSVDQLFTPDIASRMSEFLHASVTERELIMELQITEANQLKDYEARFIAIEPAKIMAIIRNVSRQKAYETQLKEAKERAELASMAKSEFLANMSHEIRTPMNAILGFTDILLNNKIDENTRSYLQTIMESGNTLLALINDILDLSKIEAGKLEIKNDQLNIRRLLNEIIHIFAQKAEEKNLNLTLDIAPNTPATVYLDQVRLRQILFNLVGNAIKFTEKGHVILAVEADAILPDQQKASLSFKISDTGIGIPVNQKNKIFEAFRQYENINNKRYGGTGLGLSITLKLAERMGGSIFLQSAPGKGSTFTVTFSKVSVSQENTITQTKTQQGIPVNFHAAGLLIADDLKANVDIIKAMLKKTNLQILEAYTGNDARELLKKERPQVVLLDLRMPGLDGYALAAEIKNNPHTKDIAVIAYTASFIHLEKNRTNNHFDGIIRKPVTRKALMEELKNHLAYDEFSVQAANEQQNEGAVVELENYKDFYATFYNRLWRIWEANKEHLVLFYIEDFAGEVLQEANRLNVAPVKNYGNELTKAVERVDLEAINRLLMQYPEVLKHVQPSR